MKLGEISACPDNNLDVRLYVEKAAGGGGGCAHNQVDFYFNNSDNSVRGKITAIETYYVLSCTFKL